MSVRGLFWNCMYSPRLVKIYGNGPVEKLYEPNSFEKWGDQVIQSLYIMCKIGLYTSPMLGTFLYRKGYFAVEGLMTLSRLMTSLGVILAVSFCIRSVGRSKNGTYQKFIKTLHKAQANLTSQNKQEMAVYDFEFSSWPVEFQWSDCNSDGVKHRLYISKSVQHRNTFQIIAAIPCNIIAYLAVHTFGIRLIYPGSLTLLQTILAQSLLQGRSKLIEVNRGMRYKLRSSDDNDIDVMFVDRRPLKGNGSTLVICCEGNAGFYEIGIVGTPIEAGYSVLGWNHPGFGGSTGAPYPSQEQNAIDIVMQFAINKLDFKPENILLFGWSIGGYSSTWAAMNYPNIKGIILDASFDDILPLAINHMPRWAESIVKLAIRDYVNLNNFEQLSKYPGPVLFIRRTNDEVVCTTENDLNTNRGNYFLMKLLKCRYPVIIGDEQISLLKEHLSKTSPQKEQFLQAQGVNADLNKSLIESYVSEHSKSYPMRIGAEMTTGQKNQMALFLAEKYMKDLKSTHCNPLPTEIFQAPWDVHIETDYVFT